MTDERMRELYQHALARQGDREHCVAPEAMLALLRREGPEEQRLETLDHVMACAACRSEMDLLRSIEQAGAETERKRVVRLQPRRTWQSLVPLALAASVLFAIIGIRQLFRGSEGPEVLRGTADTVTLLAPPSEVAADGSITFAWDPVPGARQYELEVLDEKGTVVFAATTDQTSVALRDVRRLVPGSRYRWGVRADTAAGERTSRLRSLRIKK
jgi:hypothetical protein